MKFKQQLEAEKYKIEESLFNNGFNLSNLEKAIDLSLRYSLKLPELWTFGDLEVKRSIQKMVFPEGILFDFKKDSYRTTRVNAVFDLIPSFSNNLKDKKNGTDQNKVDLSRLVPEVGIEPTLRRTRV